VCAEAEEPDGGPKQPTVQAKVEDQLSWEILFYCKGNCRSEGGGSLSQLAGDPKSQYIRRTTYTEGIPSRGSEEKRVRIPLLASSNI
jgi:hypothetical protein